MSSERMLTSLKVISEQLQYKILLGRNQLQKEIAPLDIEIRNNLGNFQRHRQLVAEKAEKNQAFEQSNYFQGYNNLYSIVEDITDYLTEPNLAEAKEFFQKNLKTIV